MCCQWNELHRAVPNALVSFLHFCAPLLSSAQNRSPSTHFTQIAHPIGVQHVEAMCATVIGQCKLAATCCSFVDGFLHHFFSLTKGATEVCLWSYCHIMVIWWWQRLLVLRVSSQIAPLNREVNVRTLFQVDGPVKEIMSPFKYVRRAPEYISRLIISKLSRLLKLL